MLENQLVLMLVGHFVGDWLWQPRDMALRKSKELVVLLRHLFRVNLCLMPFYLAAYDWEQFVIAALAYVILHGLQDWYWWRLVGGQLDPDRYYQQKEFYDGIAVDQLLHLLVLTAIYFSLGAL